MNVAPEETQGRRQIEDHRSMSDEFDNQLQNRNDFDSLLGQLSVESEKLRAAVENLTKGDNASTTRQPPDDDAEVAEALSDELALLHAQLEAARGIAAAQTAELSRTEEILAARRSGIRKAFGVADLRSALTELRTVEQRIRLLENQRMELSKAADVHLDAVRALEMEYEAEGIALREQLAELVAKGNELERRAALSLEAGGGGGERAGLYNSISPAAADQPSPAATSALREAEQALRKELELVNLDIATIEDALNRDIPLASSPRERMHYRELPPSGLSAETLIRIMQLLKASLFNLSADFQAIADTVEEIHRSRELTDDYEQWRRSIVGDAFASAAKFVHQPYDSDASVAERMLRKLRRLILVCDTVEGLTPEWVLEFAARRGIALEISQFYEVAMECNAVLLEHRRRRHELYEQKRALAQSATRGKVFASLGMRRATGVRPPNLSSRTPSQAALSFLESEDDASS